jgi:hypothetical protein
VAARGANGFLQARRKIAETACKHKSADEAEDEEKDWREEKGRVADERKRHKEDRVPRERHYEGTKRERGCQARNQEERRLPESRRREHSTTREARDNGNIRIKGTKDRMKGSLSSAGGRWWLLRRTVYTEAGEIWRLR